MKKQGRSLLAILLTPAMVFAIGIPGIAAGIAKNEYGWWKCTDSKVTFKENGHFSNQYGTWYVKKSKVDFKFNGKVRQNGKTYTIRGGKVVT